MALKRTVTMCSTLGLILFLLTVVCRAENWDKSCPSKCTCKWYKNKKVADCSNTGFSTIPSRLSGEVQVLELEENSLRGLRRHAFKSIDLINLHQLFLSKNRIKQVDKDAFDSLVILMDLDLSYNEISELHPDTFTGMEKMRKLILDNNPISRLEADQFPVLENLHHLQINNCKLTYVNVYAFRNLKNINAIGLTGNQLKVLSPLVFSKLTKLRSVQLGDNEWVCDCYLRELVRWIKNYNKAENEVSCISPKRLAKKRLQSLEEVDLACAPQVSIPRKEVPIGLGGNATLACGASAVPAPSIEWVWDGRVLLNATELLFSEADLEPHVRFLVSKNRVGQVYWSNLTVIQNGHDFMLHDFDQWNPFRCKVENAAELVERNVTLVLAEVVESPVTTGSSLETYIVSAATIIGILLIILIVLVVVCLVRRRPPRDPKGGHKALLERNNVVVVNPVEKPPRKAEHYEQLPMADVELTELTRGSHKNFEEMNYPEERGGRVRSPLTPLEEEEFDQASLNTTTTMDLALQYPDLLDTVRLPPRSISPTQLSYHSLINPLYASPEWRYSYAYPESRFSLSPPPVQRPGYVTLPRRPKDSLLKSSVYDALGPRTTADGTSRTDLTSRPSSRIMVEPPALSPRHFSPGVTVTLPRTIPLYTPEEDEDQVSSPSTAGEKKKVPPKPPPKPLSKRLSVASTDSTSVRSSDGGPFREEGSDGTEV